LLKFTFILSHYQRIWYRPPLMVVEISIYITLPLIVFLKSIFLKFLEYIPKSSGISHDRQLQKLLLYARNLSFSESSTELNRRNYIVRYLSISKFAASATGNHRVHIYGSIILPEEHLRRRARSAGAAEGWVNVTTTAPALPGVAAVHRVAWHYYLLEADTPPTRPCWASYVELREPPATSSVEIRSRVFSASRG